MKPPPFVLIFSALDGVCGAGIVADCRAVSFAGALPLVVATAIAPQNLDGVLHFHSFSAAQIRRQTSALQNAKVAVCKVGAAGSAISAIAAALPPAAKVVWDPVLSPTCGAPFADAKQIVKMKKHFLSRAEIVTPNRRELAMLSGKRGVEDGARMLIRGGAKMVLATDICQGAKVRHALFSAAASPLWRAQCRRRRGVYHGSGCLFSATLAARLALGDSPSDAAEFSHRQTLAAIDQALRLPALGKQLLPTLRIPARPIPA